MSRGEISLDMEDSLGPYDWPEMKDLTLDMLKHSVHFPLIPNVRTKFGCIQLQFVSLCSNLFRGTCRKKSGPLGACVIQLMDPRVESCKFSTL